MPINIVVPELGESVVSATVARWLKQEGERVAAGEALVELETEKVNLEVGAEQTGVLQQISRREGEDVHPGDVLGVLEKAPEGSKAAAPAPPRETAAAQPTDGGRREPPAPAPAARPDVGPALTEQTPARVGVGTHPEPSEPRLAPPTDGRGASEERRREERVRMSRRRQTIARRLVEAQRTAAMLTTFNEVNMSRLLAIRSRHRDALSQRHGLVPGLTAFFVKAAVGALKTFPRLNAEIQGDEMVLKHYYDIGVAVGAEDGLVVPVLRDVDRLSLIEIEQRIKALSQKARDGSLSLDDLRGGTFSLTNGGVFGSLLSTPILNPPQVGILGLHKVQERPVVQDGAVAVQPMMYLALSYDHRIVDGREAVQFLVRVKELIEEPALLLVEG